MGKRSSHGGLALRLAETGHPGVVERWSPLAGPEEDDQRDVLLSGHLDLAKIALTFAVPYCVAAYGAVSARPQMTPSVSSPEHEEGRHPR